jgi:hypothetical protein
MVERLGAASSATLVVRRLEYHAHTTLPRRKRIRVVIGHHGKRSTLAAGRSTAQRQRQV